MSDKMPLQISDRVRALGQQAQRELAEQFDRIDEIAAFNTEKVLAAFQKHKVAESFSRGPQGTATMIWAGKLWGRSMPISSARKMPWCASIL